MKWLRKFFKRHEPVTINDTMLGKLVSDPYGNWNGTWATGPHGLVAFSIRTGDAPPNADESKWVGKTFDELSELWISVRSRAFEGLDDFQDGTTMEQMFDSLRIEYVFFWDLSPGSSSWEISCVTDLADHIFCFGFEGNQYLDLRLDG